MEIRMMVVTHKEYQAPQDEMYDTIFVGSSKIKPCSEYLLDSTGDHISDRNPRFCELTAVYWTWKNITADYIGISHYRRFFTLGNDVLTEKEAKTLFKKSSVLVPKPRRFYFESLSKHYVNSKKGMAEVHRNDLLELRNALIKIYPNYVTSFDIVMKSNKAHMLNMFFMRSDYFSKYCNWLFEIMFELEKRLRNRVDQKRYIGALSEFMLDVWLIHNNISYYETKLLETEKRSIFKKGFSVIKRKFFTSNKI